MNEITGKPHALKQVNLSAVRKAIKERASATRAEIVEATKISTTTVRKLLTEMQENNEIVESGFDESIGGRRAVRYEFKKNRFFGAALCLAGESVRYFIVNLCGEIQKSGTYPISGDVSESICALLEQLTATAEIKAVGIGVPGIVNGMSFQNKLMGGQLLNHPIGEIIQHRFGIPIILENDLNATAFGLGRRCLKTMSGETGSDGRGDSFAKSCNGLNLAYVHFEKSCVSAGFISGGRLLRGAHNFVGELGLYPVDEHRTLDELLSSHLSDEQYTDIITRLFSGICCILNPRQIAIGGDYFRKDCLPAIKESFQRGLPGEMCAELFYTKDIWDDYSEGMAYLTADQIFSDVKLVKE